jgi:hypothetical protein
MKKPHLPLKKKETGDKSTEHRKRELVRWLERWGHPAEPAKSSDDGAGTGTGTRSLNSLLARPQVDRPMQVSRHTVESKNCCRISGSEERSQFSWAAAWLVGARLGTHITTHSIRTAHTQPTGIIALLWLFLGPSSRQPATQERSSPFFVPHAASPSIHPASQLTRPRGVHVLFGHVVLVIITRWALCRRSGSSPNFVSSMGSLEH